MDRATVVNQGGADQPRHPESHVAAQTNGGRNGGIGHG